MIVGDVQTLRVTGAAANWRFGLVIMRLRPHPHSFAYGTLSLVGTDYAPLSILTIDRPDYGPAMRISGLFPYLNFGLPFSISL
jgi:hypothetical protein